MFPPSVERILSLLACAACAVLGSTAAIDPSSAGNALPPAAVASITIKDLESDLGQLASPPLEGRDSPSDGLKRAATWIEGRFKQAGWKPVSGESYRHAFTVDGVEPEAAKCKLELSGASAKTFTFGTDFVPVTKCGGEVEGELVFLGFGIESAREHFDEVEGKDLEGKIALIVEGEPRHPKRFDGPELSPDANIWRKLASLRTNGLAGAIVARRVPDAEKKKPGSEVEPAKLSFRYTWAEWNGEPTTQPREITEKLLPALEVSMQCANELLGEDVEALCERIDRACKPIERKPPGRRVKLASSVRDSRVSVDNVVALLEGSDAKLRAEYVVLGAHYDHVGVDERGRIGCGADDNASGTAAMLEVMQALALAKPRRSVLACSFAAEEDGLLGSKALCNDPPVAKDAIVAMVNMDMVGRGEAAEVAVLGIVQNPALEKVLQRAKQLSRTGVTSLVLRQGEDLFQRSDHYSFHSIGVPVLFFFEGLPISKNADYHTWRDTLDKLDFDKIANTSRLVLNTVWLLADDDERPPRPRG